MVKFKLFQLRAIDLCQGDARRQPQGDGSVIDAHEHAASSGHRLLTEQLQGQGAIFQGADEGGGALVEWREVDVKCKGTRRGAAKDQGEGQEPIARNDRSVGGQDPT